MPWPTHQLKHNILLTCFPGPFKGFLRWVQNEIKRALPHCNAGTWTIPGLRRMSEEWQPLSIHYAWRIHGRNAIELPVHGEAWVLDSIDTRVAFDWWLNSIWLWFVLLFELFLSHNTLLLLWEISSEIGQSLLLFFSSICQLCQFNPS